MKINKNINAITIYENVSIVDAMSKLNIASDQTLFVVNAVSYTHLTLPTKRIV